MKKFKMVLGTCGPHIMYTNIIKADSPEEAARKYLGYDATEEEVAKTASHMYEVEPRAVRNEDESFVDAIGVEIGMGKSIAFICRQDANSIKEGKVSRITKSTITVVSGDKQYRLLADPEEGRSIKKAIVIDWKKKKASKDSHVDAIGQLLKAGSSVAYRQETYADNCKGFLYGTITKVTGTYAFIRDMEKGNEVRRKHGLIVVMKHA